MSTIPRDGCLVTAEPFAELVRSHVRRWNRDRPQLGGTWTPREDLPPIQPLVWLSAEASHLADPCGDYLPHLFVPVGLLEKLVPRGLREWIELRVADAIATALDEPGLIWDPAVEVIPNRRAKRELRASCCSGSTYAIAV